MMTVMLVILAATLSLYLRIDHFHHFASRHLWAEDGAVFLNDASAGWSALWRPYSGYIHLYPRLTALTSQYVELINRPNILLCGWLISYALLVYSIARLMRTVGASPTHTAIAVALVSLQPNNGEVLFNITNSQWMIGAALFLIAITPRQDAGKISLVNLGVVTLMGLTGPFAALLTPIIVFFLWHKHTWKGNRSSYVAIIVSALIQSWILLSSDRMTTAKSIAPVSEWIITFFRQITMGAAEPTTYIAAFLFISIASYLTVKAPKHSSERRTSTAIIIAFSVLVLASAYAFKDTPLLTAPLASGVRYNWIPYTLAILYGMTITARSGKKVKFLLVSLIAFMNLKSSSTIVAEELQFQSYARLAAIRPVTIPIRPVLNIYPGWNIKAYPAPTLHRPPDIDTDFPASFLRKDLSSSSATPLEDKHILFKSESGHESFVIDIGDRCKTHLSVGLEIDMERSNDGFTVLGWSDSEGFPEQNSLKRWYPKGAITAQFAFQRGHQSRFLQITPMDSQGTSIINSLRIYCLN